MDKLKSISSPFSYTFAGLNIKSNIKIEQLSISGYADDEVNFCFKKETSHEKYYYTDWLISSQPNGLPTYIRKDGSVVTVIENEDSVSDKALEIRRVLPYVSYLKDKPLLHASSVLIDGRVVGFIGESGVGKSSLAKELGNSAYKLISDDLLPMRVIDETIIVPNLDNNKVCMYPVDTLFFLTRKKELDDVLVKSVSMTQSLNLLLFNAFGDLAYNKLWSIQFNFFLNLVKLTNCFLLEIPDDKARLRQSAADIVMKLKDFK